ncbi:hypothetical protein DLAC_10659 [Tieghemostelium lacteum]|uniref:RNA ligase domain-containing protein n=1 Tax=Tieghemostelium lacteum TaxID=361077 RepID=A0A151Z4I4_TIELA|nr:hypothetical protein DLAC_10659 [Tieghemostelium lacteum]|eukprot:KYQ88855.1 hypothetical protein DLAC_10659 [Tieghemostelium lacteum]
MINTDEVTQQVSEIKINTETTTTKVEDNNNNETETTTVEENLLEESDRVLAYFERIKALEPIKGADVIEIATVLGWRVIVKKGLYKVGDMVVYCEIDSVLPKWDYFIGDRLDKCQFKIKTIKLRGELSQGYCIPIKQLIAHPERTVTVNYHKEIKDEIVELVDTNTKEVIPLQIGYNVTKFIGITKIQDNHGRGRGGGGTSIFSKVMVKSNLLEFPSFIRKTDQTRIQNCPHYLEDFAQVQFEVTEKLEGSSITAYHHKGVSGICSRNYEIKNVEESVEINQVLLKDLNILERLQKLKLSIAIQGEIIGPKIQGNIYGLEKSEFRVFDIFLIETQRYATHQERVDIMKQMELPWEDYGVPFICEMKLAGKKLSEILDMANGFSQLKGSRPKVLREGLVFKSKSVENNRVVTFKSISNQYLLKKE